MRFGFIGSLVLTLWTMSVLAADRPLRVVTTFLPAYCFAANVGGNSAEVENLLPGTVSLHDYQLTPGDIRKLASADLIVVNGLGMETFLDKAISNIGPGAGAKIVRMSDGLGRELLEETGPAHQHEPGHEHSQNAHIWLDPQLAKRCVTNIARAFQKRDPANATSYGQNAAEYCSRLQALDGEIQAGLQSVQDAPFITYHNAFPYFVRRYGLKLAGVVEKVPEVSPSPREMSQLLKTIRAEKVRALFTEPGARSRLAEQIARDAGIRLAELDPLETGPFTPQAYEQGMRRNLSVLAKTLKP